MPKKILFLDRDGTLIHEPDDHQIDTLAKLELEPFLIPTLLSLNSQGYQFVMVTNQDGLGTEHYPQSAFDCVQTKLLSLLDSQGIRFEAILICPHFESEHCECRKPRLGLVLDYLNSSELDKDRSYVIGDRKTDQMLAENMRLNSILYDRKNNNWPAILSQLQTQMRLSKIQRKTNETCIDVSVNLDCTTPIHIKTSLGFFDHMLEQLAKHAGISIELKAVGDLHIDEHHLIEDTALALGECLRQALGDKYGVSRYGFLLPMDEAITQVALDLSGRPYFVFDGTFSREKVGEFPTELVSHFFRSFSEALKATLHLTVRGDNTHHQIESIFKGVGRAFKQAKTIDGIDLPSTKGVL